MSNYVRFQLKPNKEIEESIQQYFNDYNRMLNIGRSYNAQFTEAGYTGVSAVYHTDYTAATNKLVGFKVNVENNSELTEQRIEIRHENINTFKAGTDFQPLKKNKYNKEKTNNFQYLEVSYIPIIQAIYGNTDTFKMIEEESQPQLLIKSFGYGKVDGKFQIRVLEEDINDYILENYTKIEEDSGQ